MIFELFTLLILFQVKHFVCDYIWQTGYMLGKFKKKGWVLPLLAHVSVHGVATFTIAFLYLSTNTWTLYAFAMATALALLDMVMHFTMDRIKASPNLFGRFKPEQPVFWYTLGFDQMVHHMTHYVLIYFLITA